MTVTYTISDAGNALAPMMIFPRVQYRDHFVCGSPLETVGKASKSDWINEEIAVDVLGHVAELICSSPNRKILVFMDNHETHISLATINKARDLGIVLLTIPPHTSH